MEETRRSDRPGTVGTGSETLAGYGRVFDAVGDPVVVVDDEQRIVAFNQAAETAFGHSAADVLGEPLGVLLPEHFRHAHTQQVNGFRSHGKGHVVRASQRSSVVGLHRTGYEFPVEVTLSTLQMEGDIMAVATIRDVSERTAAELALAESERRFRVLFEDSPVAIALVDLEGRLVVGNQALADLTDYTLSELAEMTMAELLDSDHLPALTEQMQPLLAGTVNTARFEVQQRTRDGTPLTIDLNLATVRDEVGAAEYLIGQAVNITDRVEARRRLEELIESKDELIASVSHGFRTPLTALVGFARLLHDESSGLSVEERSGMVAAIVAQSAELTNLVDDLLVAAKSDTGDLAVVHVPVDLRAQASQVIELLNPDERRHVKLSGSSVTAIGDPARVRQIIRSLITNAVRYGGYTITVRLKRTAETSSLSVADNGSPIPEEDQARIFEPFQRAHPTVGTAPSLGLGLSISRQLARLMGGDLTVRCEEAENIFELTLPRAD